MKKNIYLSIKQKERPETKQPQNLTKNFRDSVIYMPYPV